MLNRKLTEADMSKKFEVSYQGEDGEFIDYVFLASCNVPYRFELSDYMSFVTDEKGFTLPDNENEMNWEVSEVGEQEVLVSEVEEPEEFRLTGKEVWRAATKEHQKELDDALGLKDINLKINASVFDALEEKAKQQGIILKALVRQILTDHVANQ